MKDPIENMVFKILDDFKDGVVDGLMHGIRSETNETHYYKQGYDFGVSLYSEQIDEEEYQSALYSKQTNEEINDAQTS